MNNSTNTSENRDAVDANLQQLEANVSRATSAVSEEFQNFLTDIETLMKATQTLTGEELELAKAKFNERVAAARVAVENVSRTVSERACDTMEMTNTYVHEQPWKAVGVGTAIGFLLGLALARRN